MEDLRRGERDVEFEEKTNGGIDKLEMYIEEQEVICICPSKQKYVQLAPSFILTK